MLTKEAKEAFKGFLIEKLQSDELIVEFDESLQGASDEYGDVITLDAEGTDFEELVEMLRRIQHFIRSRHL